MNYNSFFRFSASLFLLGAVACQPTDATFSRETDFNFDWKFTELPDTTTLTQLPLADQAWRDVRLPHDWSVEHSFDKALEGCTGYLPGGVGVYQKHFKTPINPEEQTSYVLFDGVYNNAKFWLNGKYLGENPYGYSPVYFDLTSLLKTDGTDNILSVYVDHSRYADSRWYTGSGIYRDVTLVNVDKLHIPIWGTFVTTPDVQLAADGEHASKAAVNVAVRVVNKDAAAHDFELTTEVLDASGKVLVTRTQAQRLTPGTEQEFNQRLDLAQAKLWDTETPDLYTAVTRIERAGKLVDEQKTVFGVRTLEHHKDKGFFLNGKSTFVKGVCLHHDGGLVGAAVPKGVWRRRLQTLKDAGCNAIRTSHNPFSDEFLELCDEMGFLVQNEIFDEMDNPKDKRFNFGEKEPLYRTTGYDKHFQQWAESDLKRTILRDRNHPSVFQYSIGNEIEWTYPDYKHVSGLWDPGTGGYWNRIPHLTPEEMRARYDALPAREHVLARTAKKLATWVKDVDTTRPVTANLIIPTASCVTGYADALDVVGFSYQINQYKWCKEHFPHMMFTGSENSGYLSEWKSITDNPMVFSMYMWTGIDYMGESTNRWPQKAWPGDMLDLAGFKKAGWNHFKSIWNEEPHLSIQTHPISESLFAYDQKKGLTPKKGNQGKAYQWQNYLSKEHWNYQDGEMVVVEVVTNQPEVELFHNGSSVGVCKLADTKDQILRWAVPYKAGVLVAQAGADAAMIMAELKTAAAPAKLKVNCDKVSLANDGYDVAHIEVHLVDDKGVPVKTQEQEVTFSLQGDARLLGVDNGWNESTQDFQSNKVTTYQGRCLAIVQSNLNGKEKIQVKVQAKGLPEQLVTIEL